MLDAESQMYHRVRVVSHARFLVRFASENYSYISFMSDDSQKHTPGKMGKYLWATTTLPVT